MEYAVTVDYITRNRSYQKLDPIGIVIHETATPNATAKAEHDYFNSGDRGASAHAFVDPTSIVVTIPWDEVAWHAGPTANDRFESIELCHFDDPAQFAEVWKRGIWLTQQRCKARGWGSDRIWSHDRVSKAFGESDHTDPIGYFANHGKTFEDFINDVFASDRQEDEDMSVKLVTVRNGKEKGRVYLVDFGQMTYKWVTNPDEDKWLAEVAKLQRIDAPVVDYIGPQNGFKELRG